MPDPPPCRACHHRHAQTACQGFTVHFDAPPLCLIHQVHQHHHFSDVPENLIGEDQVPLQTGGVAYHHQAVKFPLEQRIPGHLFLLRLGVQRIGTRQIRQLIVPPLIAVAASGQGHGFPGPVARVLVHSRQGLEHRGLPHVGISRQQDGQRAAHGSASTRICSASPRRSAITAPRIS